MTDHNQDIDELNLPIALRRTRRTGTGTVRRTPGVSGVGRRSAIKRNPSVACTREVSPPTPPTTPRRDWKNRITKTVTVRGNKTHLQLSSGAVNGLVEDELSSTGLTPMVRRTSLQPPSPAPGSSKCTYKNDNTATPSPRRSALTKLVSTQQPSTSNQADRGTETASSHILPLRQSHHKRHTIQTHRSASLSSTSGEEKMNRAYTEWRKREREAQEEIERLRAELKEKNETIERFHQDDETVELELDGGMVDAERNPARSRELEMEREKAERQTAVLQQQQQQPHSPETPNNLTFHTALSMRQGEDLRGNEGEDRQQQYMALNHHHRHHDPGSGSETEALSLTTSQFSEAIRARLDCSTPPPSGSRARHHRLLPTTTTAATATAAGPRLFPTPPTTGPMTMAMATATARAIIPINNLTPGTELPITPCSNSRHGARSTSSSSRRTSEATTIHNLHHNHNGMNEEEATPTRALNRGGGPEEQQLHSEKIATLTTQNTTLQASLSRAQSSLRVALQLVKKLEIESDRLRGETLLLQREKRELLEDVREMRSDREVVRERVRSALERRDEMWKGRMKMLGEGIVEGVRGAFEEVIEDVLMDSGVEGMDEMPGREPEGLPTARMSREKRKRGREEEEEDADEEEEEEEDQVHEDMQEWEGGDGASCDLGAGNSGAGGSSGRGSYDDGLEDIERRNMRVRERMMRKRRRRTSGFGTEEEEDADPDA
ncbi:hypothetical protein NEUTE1DRAFT_85589 [Neurospora tetrasperma FGSC 2508]|uniref:Uncharacterized protein n=1 Tax=Neurospora tetrasperma (strain FGSC 2508 / ATCC MYA-4615 / P0657) TaxID=510951 RepID=F8MTN0_NEUT8|nr:uncharacterized protein NEUTE1DRAFT_85589 [Neurospora tetrasperma FGSC 2508]EGO55362.1 hypothetical protein NEUTE1DRAFT_85589 [Neurospora tetrasperma FGSC 2508]EGZ69412.1 hypothetical protein NEUTE2DRAFT_115925 [Neurospora tetrasperma FGSC 2509]